MKKIVIALLVSLMILSLAGCKSAAPVTSETTGNVTETASEPQDLLKELNGLAASGITLDELANKGYNFAMSVDHTESGVALAYKLYKLDTADIYAVVYSYLPEDQSDNNDNKVLLLVDDPESEEIYNKFSEVFDASHPVE